MIGLINGKWVLILTVQKPPRSCLQPKKKNTIHYPPITFNKFPVERVQFHKHLGLNSKLNFNEYISLILSKVNKFITVLRKLLFYQGIPF